MSKKYIFITGGASGMGKSTVQLFIDKGWFVGCYPGWLVGILVGWLANTCISQMCL